jgi:AraC-like DNA-binding protein
MQTIMTTAGMPPRDAFEYWHDVARIHLIKHQASPLDRHNFRAEIKVGTLDDLSVLACKRSAIEWRSYPGDDLLLLSAATPIAMAFGDRQFETDGASLVLLDTREPHFGRTLGEANPIGVRIPRTALTQRIPISETMTNRPLPLCGDAMVLANFIRSIIQTGPSTLSPAARILARERVLDLTTLVLGNLAVVTPEFSSPERIVMAKLRMAIECRLTDLTADRESIAAAVGFSERHLNRLLSQQEGMSITQLLRKRRLAKCREALEQQSHRQINDIAREFGWTLTSNFTRDFKQEFGLTPREARQLINKK